MSINTDHNCNTPEPEDPYAVIFWETHHRIEQDTEWVTAEPRSEIDLLHRYFGDHVRCLKDLLDYRGILGECLENLDNPDIKVTDRVSDYGLPDALMESSEEELFEGTVSSVLQESAGWLLLTPRTIYEITDHLFQNNALGGMQREDVRTQLYRALLDFGFTPNCVDTDNPTWTRTDGN